MRCLNGKNASWDLRPLNAGGTSQRDVPTYKVQRMVRETFTGSRDFAAK